MEPAKIKALMASWTAEDEDNEPIFVSRSDLKHLDVADFASGARIEVGKMKGNEPHVELEGYLTKGATTPLQLEIQEIYQQKSWSSPIGMRHYFDLVRRAIENRQKIRGDVILGGFDGSDTPFVRFNYSVLLDETSVSKAYAEGLKINRQLFEPADLVKSSVAEIITKEAQKLSLWGALPLQKLIDQVEVQNTNDNKGQVLEELACKLFGTVPGFIVTQRRMSTETEEIDIRIRNESSDPIWRRESVTIIAECKNCASKTDTKELNHFQKKVSNRNQRCSCGFLISWNGFTTAVFAELLRTSREDGLIILVTGKDLRAAALAGSFEDTVRNLWERATST